jgi:hypothetical protein
VGVSSSSYEGYTVLKPAKTLLYFGWMIGVQEGGRLHRNLYAAWEVGVTREATFSSLIAILKHRRNWVELIIFFSFLYWKINLEMWTVPYPMKSQEEKRADLKNKEEGILSKRKNNSRPT